MGRLYLPLPQLDPYDTFLHYSSLGPRCPGYLQELFPRTILRVRDWRRRSGTSDLPLRPLTTGLQEENVRGFRCAARSSRYRVLGHAFLALP